MTKIPTLVGTVVTLKDAAEVAGCSTARIRQKIKEGSLTPIKRGGHVFVRDTDLAQYLDRRAAWLAATEKR